MIEFLFKPNEFDLVIYHNNTNFNSTRKFIYTTGISKQQFSKKITFKLQSDKKLNFRVFLGYSIIPYSYYYPGDKNDISSFYPSNEGTFSVAPEEIELMDDEYFFVLFENLGSYLYITISEEEVNPDQKEDETDKKEEDTDKNEGNADKKEDENKGEEGLESWQIALIVVGSIIFLIILLLIVFYFFRKNKRLTDKTIEDKMENLHDLR